MTKKAVGIIRVRDYMQLVKAGELLEHGNHPAHDTWYRGQGNCEWHLKSTIERDGERFGLSIARNLYADSESTILKLFKERAHLYAGFNDPESIFDWYALIRHYGGPSRLLDVTSSYLVAAYFALIDSQEKTDPVIWAFRGLKRQETVQDLVFNNANAPQDIIVSKPTHLNDRMNAQSGAFLIPTSVEHSLEEQIEGALDTDLNKSQKYRSVPATADQHRVWKVVIPHGKRSELLKFVSRCNVRGYSLIPGLEGVGQSLREMMCL